MSIFHAPLYEALKRHIALSPRSFHVPGHQYGRALHNKAPDTIYRDYEALLKLDVTELSGTDDLHHPEGVIQEAQQLAARTFGAEETFFLVGGSTAGNLALILAHCAPGDILIVQRNVHKSILNGLQLAGAQAVFITPSVEPDTGLPTVPSIQQIEEALRRYPNAKAVMLTNPNYYGMGVELHRYVELIHRYGKPVFVDEAHGAHYGIHPDLPGSALNAGADGVVQSTHKTLSAMTMGAMLHVQGSRIDRFAIRRTLAMIQSSSPSYPIMASLDLARAIVHQEGAGLFEQAIRMANLFRQQMQERLPIFLVMGTEARQPYYDYMDPLRIVISDSTGALSGYELQKQLEAYGCWAEMADPRHVVLLFGISTSLEDMEALIHACEVIAATISMNADRQHSFQFLLDSGVSEPVSFSRTLSDVDDVETIPLSESAQRIAAEMIIPYPPGIPILYPGERIHPLTVTTLQQLARHGAKCQGASDPTLTAIRVYRGAKA
ncbi:aminotransferase class I/II-fold pyridoxal phosphate-dependent enzyme [Paenibacillus abyssi]|uniref:Lysine decarboxylase n=1 Tax=Paenibacillus abyssi TaxID=1340531 RepID=A0A917G5W2_9BACL|nr:aminotransferase class I/II-fold pyridoxal phosphate-dependent enzyme [Paenibacillus abyssi]GGG24419.1 lysine decarboxylase [Paenibacillus abyssi]